MNSWYLNLVLSLTTCAPNSGFLLSIITKVHNKPHEDINDTRGDNAISIEQKQNGAIVVRESKVSINGFPLGESSEHQAVGISDTDNKQGQIADKHFI